MGLYKLLMGQQNFLLLVSVPQDLKVKKKEKITDIMTKIINKIKCPYCGRIIKKSKGGSVMPHIQSSKVLCVGSGQKWEQAVWLRKMYDKRS